MDTGAELSDATMAAPRVAAVSDFWTLFAAHSGLVGAWRLTAVCRAARVGVKEWLQTLPGLLVCGGCGAGAGRRGVSRAVWQLRLDTMRWECVRGATLARERYNHACCVVRKDPGSSTGTLVVLGGYDGHDMGHSQGYTASVEALALATTTGGLRFTTATATTCAQLSCGAINVPCALALLDEEEEGREEGEKEEEDSMDSGHVLLLGGALAHSYSREVLKVCVASGACTPLPRLCRARMGCAAARLADGRVLCVGGRNDQEEVRRPYLLFILSEL